MKRWAEWYRSALLLATMATQGGAWAAPLDDPFSTATQLPLPVNERLASLALPCASGSPSQPLTPLDAVRQALCQNPRTRAAWAAVEAQAAAAGTAQSAYWPGVTAAAGISQVSASAEYPDQPELDSAFDGSSNEQSLRLDWVLYDFGLRAANLRQERALFRAACASQNEEILAVFLDTIRSYFAAEQAQAALAAEAQAEQAGEQSAAVAQAKVKAGVGQEADRLQAATAQALASLNRIRAREALDIALGRVAVVLGTRPGTALSLAVPDDTAVEDLQADARIESLMSRAFQVHPRIALARERLEAARDAVSTERAGGRPTVSLTAFGERSDTPVDRVASRQNIESSGIGLRFRAPLFEGFGRLYRIRQAEALLEGREAELQVAQQEVAQAVWESYIAVRGSADARKASAALLDSARQSQELALGRYQAGVGTILELLRAQSDLAAARQQEVVARTRWRLARLELAASLGRIDFRMLREAEKE